jgi:hypothetical protein
MAKSWIGPVAGFIAGLVVAGCALYFAIIVPGDKLAAAGRVTITELAVANGKLSRDLASARSDVSDLARQRDDRQRVINKIDGSVKQLGSGLGDGIETLDRVIKSIQDIIDILRNG